MSYARPVQRSSRQYDFAPAVGQTAFGFPDPLFDTADLRVFVKPGFGQAFAEVLQPGWAVTLSAGLSNGLVAFAAAPRTDPLAQVTVRLTGARVQSRLSDVSRGGSVQSKPLEDELDRTAIILQELRRDLSTLTDAVNSAYAGAVAAGAAARRSSFLLGLEGLRPGAVQEIAQSLPADPANPLTLSWADPFVTPVTPLAVYVQVTYGLSDVQMSALYASTSAAPLIAGRVARRSAFLAALEVASPGAVQALGTSIPGDPANALALAWADGVLDATSPILPFAQLLLGLSAATIAAAFVTGAINSRILP